MAKIKYQSMFPSLFTNSGSLKQLQQLPADLKNHLEPIRPATKNDLQVWKISPVQAEFCFNN
ncbi:MAG: hypothetical protein HUJ54_08100 [Erysipelotrichaceae bacterium]|nr:hypothetical protein [Erysipelotrichaceae bacterium]